MDGEYLQTGRRKSGLKKWELAHILRINQDSLSKMERGLKPIPFELQLRIENEFMRQQEKVHYGTARNVVNSLISEGYSLAELAHIIGTTRAKVRHWQIKQSEPSTQELLILICLPPPLKSYSVKRKTTRVRRKAGW